MIRIFCVFCFLVSQNLLAEPFLKKAEWQEAVQTPEDRMRLALFSSLYEKAQGKPVGEIPKVLHVIWLGPDAFPAPSAALLSTWVEKHPGWQMKLWMDRDCSLPIAGLQVVTADQFPLQSCADIYYQAESYEERSLILRYAILHSEGGIYIDHDTQCVASLEPLRADLDFFCGLEEPGPSILSSSINPSCHLIGAAPHHPILECAQQWLVSHWQAYEDLLPGTDPISVDNRMVHRSVHALSVAIERAALQDGRKDSVFPPDYFSSSKPARYAVMAPKALFGRRKEQAEAKEKIETSFTAIRSQLRICLYLIVALAALNLFLGAVVFHLYRKRKGK